MPTNQADTVKPRCPNPTCGKYTDKKTLPQCFGHGDDVSSEKSASKDNAGKGLGHTIPSKVANTADQSSHVITEQLTDANLSPKPQLGETPFDPEIISDLLAKRLLFIDNNNELGTLTIKLLCNPKDLSPKQRDEFKKFVDAILKTLEEFKKENSISNRCNLLKKDKEGNILSLRIMSLNPPHYDAFIQRLSNKNLLPLPPANKKEKIEEVHKVNKQATPQEEKPSIRPRPPFLRRLGLS